MSDLTVSFDADTARLNDAVAKSKSLITQFANTIKAAFSGVNTGDADKAIEKTGDAAQEAGDKQKTTATQIGEAFGSVGVAVAAVAQHITETVQAVQAIVDPVRSAASAFDQTMGTISRVGEIAERSGLSLQDLGSSFRTLQNNAKSESDETVAALAAIGLEASDIANLTQDQLAVKMADAFATAKDSANKTQAATILFGAEVASKLLPQLNLGATRMRELATEADRTGQIIGPDLAEKVKGTEDLLSMASDRVDEFKNAWTGLLNSFKIEEFQQIKGAIDGLIQLFNDASRNILDFIESLTGLDRAAGQSATSLGLIGTIANFVASMIVEATTTIEEMGVRGTQSLAQLGVTFDGLSKVVKGFGEDVKTIATTGASALYNAFRDAIEGVIKLFGDLASAGASALSFDFSGVQSAFAKFGDDVGTTKEKIKASLEPEGFTATRAAITAMKDGSDAYGRSLDETIAKIEKQKQAQLALIAAGGQRGSSVKQTRDVGNPKEDDDDDDKKKNNDKLDAAIKELEGEIQAVKAAEKQKQMLLEAGVKLHLLSEDQKIAATRSATDAELAAETAIYQKELALDGLKLTQRQEILNKMKAAQAAHNLEILRLQIEAAEQAQKTWDAATSSINSAFESQISGLLKATTSFRQAFKNVLSSLLEDVIKFCVQWGLKQAETVAANIVGLNAQTAAQVTGAAAGTAAQTAGAATSSIAVLSGVLKSILASAAETFAGIFGFLSPVMGPAAAGPAAAGKAAVMAMATLPSMAVGAWSLPSDMVAQLHAGEMVVPAGPAAMMRAAAGAGDGGQGGGGDTHVHFNVSAMDGASVKSWLANGGARMMAKAIDQHRSLNPSLR